MRSLSSALTPLCLILPLALAGSARGQDADLRTLVNAQIERSGQGPMSEVWLAAARLRDVARDAAVEGLDGELEKALATEGLGERAALMLLAARLEGGDPTEVRGKLAEKLSPLLGSANDEIAAAAAGLAADSTFRTLELVERRALIDRLVSMAQNATRAPNVRLEAAFAACRIGMGDDVRKSRTIMSEFLESSDADLRSLGALALARSGAEISGKLFDELRRLSVLPDAQGRLAAAYLEKERTREVGERKLKNLAELQKLESGAGEAAPPADEGEFDKLDNLISMIRRAHPDGEKVTREQLLEAAMQGMLQSMDEHSSYLSPKAYERFEQDLAAGYGGIGAYVGEDRQDGLFTITRPIYSGPAYKAGLMSEDKIVRVDDWPTIGKPTDEVIKRLKGRPGTDVKLYVWRRGMDPALVDRPTEEMARVVQRAAITIPAEQHQMLPGKIGMVVLQEFSAVATAELRRPLLDMLDAGMRGVILDLRNNSGGLLDEAVNVANLFLPRGTLIVSTESPLKETEKLYTQQEPVIPADMPVIVLVNRFTASASEIVSGALQDHRRALVIGERSFGKGSVQNLIQLPPYRDDQYKDENGNHRWDNWEKITKDWDGDGEFDFAPRVKLTIARYFLPSGRSIHREVDKDGNLLNTGGVSPDAQVESNKIAAWRIEEMLRLRDLQAPREYVDAHWAEYKDRFSQIADNDRKDTALYPGFENFYKGLRTPLAPDDVRQMLRAEIRRRVQDARGQEFPQGDFVEDLQLQEGIRRVFAKLGQSTDEVDEYKSTIQPDISPRLNVASAEENKVRDALDQLNKALKADRRLSESTLRELVQLLGESLKN
jgi:C-terminal peptidase prc